MEYTHWIGENWGAAAFVDIGNAWDEGLSFDPALGYGVGGRFRTPIGPIRADLAYGEDRTIQDPFFRGLYVLAMRWLSGALLALAVLLLAAAAGIGWLVGTEQGLQWAAARDAGLHTEGLRGHLAGEVTAETLSFESSAVRLRAEQVSVRAHLAALLGGRLTLEPFRAQRSSSSFAARVKNQASRFACRYSFTSATRASIRLSCKDTSSAISRSSTHGSGRRIPRRLAHLPARAIPRARKVDLRGTPERIEARVAGEVAGVAVEGRGEVVPRSAQRLQQIDARAGPIDLARFGAPRTALHRAGARSRPAARSPARWAHNAASGPVDADRLPFTRLEARFITDFSAARLDSVHATLAGGGTVQGEATLEPRALREARRGDQPARCIRACA